MFDVFNAYWQAEDGRVFSAADQRVIPAGDAAFLAWRAAGGIPWRWPQDEGALQTDDALQAVLGRFGLFVSLEAYVRHVSWCKRTSGCPIEGIHVATDAEGLTLVNGLKGMAEEFPERAFSYDSPAGPIPLTAAQAIDLARTVGSFVQSTFDRRAEVLMQVQSGEITTRAAVDAAFADL